MSLKGYQWLRGNKVIMSFTFKDLELSLWDDVTKKEADDFCRYISKNGFKEITINFNQYKIEGV